MDPPGEPLEAVLLATARPVDAGAVGRALAPLLGLAPADAARRARVCGGIALEAAPAELAERARAALEAAGVGARRVPAVAVPPLPPAEVATAAEWTAERATFHLPRGAVEVAFASLGLVLAHALEREGGGEAERARRRAREEAREPRGVGAEPPLRRLERDPEALLAGEATGLSESGKRLVAAVLKRRRDAARDVGLVLDLVAGEGEGRRLVRVRRESLASVRPAEGEAPRHSVEAFLALARAALAGAPEHARAAPENAALVEAGLLEPALFLYAEERERYERWLMANE